jgi:hypothetical protein
MVWPSSLGGNNPRGIISSQKDLSMCHAPPPPDHAHQDVCTLACIHISRVGCNQFGMQNHFSNLHPKKLAPRKVPQD